MKKTVFKNKNGIKCGGMAFDDNANLYFYGDIIDEVWERWSDEEESKCPRDVLELLNGIDNNAPLNIYINSSGGSVFAGISIYNILKRHNGFVTVNIDGVAASIASVIAMAGDTIKMPAGSTLMIHKPWGILAGNAFEMRKFADTLDILEENILCIYKGKLREGKSLETVSELMEKETYLTADMAAEIFLIDKTDGKVMNKADKIFDFYESKQNELTEGEKILMGVF